MPEDLSINGDLLDDVMALVDGLGWTVFDLWRQPDQGSDDEFLEFLTHWRNLRHALMAERPTEFNFYDAADEWRTNISYIFRGGSAFERTADEDLDQAEASQSGYRDFLANYDADEDPYLSLPQD